MVIVTGGGTGGHVYPAVSVARSIATDYNVIYLGHPRKIEAQSAPKEGIEFIGVNSWPFPTRTRGIPLFILRSTKSILKSLRIIRSRKPSLVIGFGGYVSVPIVFAAWLGRYPILIHEQNVLPGKANRFFTKLKIPIMISFETSRKYVRGQSVYTGCPVRERIGSIDARRTLSLKESDKVCLIFGGSGGADVINNVAESLIPLLEEDMDFVLIHICGTRNYAATKKKMESEGALKLNNYRLIDYADEIEAFYAVADFAICRSGASTINELLSTKTPSILIPSPNVSENHQELNARFLEEKGCATVILESEIDSCVLTECVRNFLDEPMKLKEMSINAEKHSDGKVTARLIREQIEKSAR